MTYFFQEHLTIEKIMKFFLRTFKEHMTIEKIKKFFFSIIFQERSHPVAVFTSAGFLRRILTYSNQSLLRSGS